MSVGMSASSVGGYYQLLALIHKLIDWISKHKKSS